MDNSHPSSYRKKERIVWISITVVLTICLAVVFFSPAVLAQSRLADTERYLSEFEWIFKFVQQNYVDEISPEVLMEGAMNGLFESLNDPHSAYLNEEAMRSLTDTTSGEFGGVGIYISKPDPEVTPLKEGEHAWVEVIAPIEDTPAFKAGINAGDFITHVNGESTDPLSSDEVIDRLRGVPGSDVTVTIRRGEKLDFNVTLKREMIRVPTVKHTLLPNGIGYIRITQFTPLTAGNVRTALQDLTSKGYSKLIVDLRNNPGGLLSSVIETADLFFSDGLIVSTKSRLARENRVYTARAGQAISDKVPITVLIDKGSASAAEILAGALKDRHRATLLGETTYGKGSVQEVHPLGKTGFRLTMSKYYTPADISIDKIGIKPDIEIIEPVLSETQEKEFSDLLEKQTVENFIKTNPNPDGPAITKFVNDLKKTGITLEERLLRRLVRVAINRTLNTPPLVDLEYDIVLQEAIKVLLKADVAKENQK